MNYISELNERVIGAARVLVKYRDDDYKVKGNPVLMSKLTELADKMGTKSTPDGTCMVMPNQDCAGMCQGTDAKIYGPFKNIFNQTEDTKAIFEKSFIDGGIISSLFSEKTAVIFGFGFSGSGKTYQLAASDNTDNILAQTVRALATASFSGNPIYDSESKPVQKVQSIKLEVQELYPYTDVTLGEEKANGVKLFKKGSVKLKNNQVVHGIRAMRNEVPEYTSGVNVETFLDNIYKLFDKIEKERIDNMRISPTPNNIVSSRSHIFYELIIQLANGKESRFVIVDMAGAENTIEIRRDFLMGGKAYEEWFNIRNNNIFSKIPEEEKNTVKEIFTPLSNLGAGPAIGASKSFVKNQLGISVGGTQKSPFPLTFLQLDKSSIGSHGDNALSLVYIISNGDIYSAAEKDKWTVLISRIYMKIIYLANKMNFKKSIDADDVPKLYDLDLTVFVGMIKTFISKIITSAVVNDDKEGKSYQGKPIDNVSNLVDNIIFPIFKKYFEPYETLFMRPVKKIGTVMKDKHVSTPIEDWKRIFKYIIQNNISFNFDEIAEKNVSAKLGAKIDSVPRDKWYKDKDLPTSCILPELFSKKYKYVDYQNPLIIILCAYLYRIRDVMYGGKFNEDRSGKITWRKITLNPANLSQERNKDNININVLNKVYIIFFMGVITKYISVIVNQGNGIVTTLEHLKYYFLYNTKDHAKLEDYNKKKEGNQKLFAFEGEKNYITQSKTWKNIDQTGMYEDVENGMFKQYKTLEILTQYAQKDPNITLTDEGFSGQQKKEDKFPTYLFIPSPSGNKYIMLTAIKRGDVILNEDKSDFTLGGIDKYCMATKNTLEFADSITSVPGPCKDDIKSSTVACAKQTAGGRLRKSRKRKQKKHTKITKKRKNLNKNKIRKH